MNNKLQNINLDKLKKWLKPRAALNQVLLLKKISHPMYEIFEFLPLPIWLLPTVLLIL